MGSPKSSEVWPDIRTKLMSMLSFEKDGCWWFLGSVSNADGYGCFYWDGKSYRAHRLSYELHKGPIPRGQLVRHTCDVPWCCNPDHLVPGTDWDNANDSVMKGRRARRDSGNNGGSWLTEDSVRQIRRLLAEGRHSHREIGEMFRVTKCTVSDIKRGKSWSHVQLEENNT
jgi:hypothetical protein